MYYRPHKQTRKILGTVFDFPKSQKIGSVFLVIAMLSKLKIYAVEFFFLTCPHALGLTLQVSSVFFTVNAHSLQLLLTLWKGHTVGTNGSVDQQEVSFQNMCTWLLLPKNTQCGV